MKKIYRYTLKRMAGEQVVKLPKDAIVLDIKERKGIPSLWALVDPDETVMEDIKLRIYLTEEDIVEQENNLTYVGTFILVDGDWVCHAFIVD